MSDTAEHEDAGDEQLNQDQIWGERAQSLVAFVKTSKPPVKRGTLNTFAMRKGWEMATLESCLAYCVERKLLATYNAFSGGTAWKIPLTPVHEEDAGDAGDVELDAPPSPAPRAAPPAVVQTSAEEPPKCLCARTAPKVNYGCPQHGAARRGAEEKKQVAKHWISTAEMMELTGCTQTQSSTMARKGMIESRKLGDERGAPREFRRSSVIAFIAKRDKKKAATDLLETSQPKPKRKRKPDGEPSKTSALVKVEPRTVMKKPAKARKAPALDSSHVTDDVRALHRLVMRGGMETSVAWSTLCNLLGVPDIDWMTLCNLLGVS